MDYMTAFKLSPDTIRSHDALAPQLEQLAKQIQSANDISGKQAADQFLRIIISMYQWIALQGKDFAEYAQSIAARVDSDSGGIDEETFEMLTKLSSHLEDLNNLFEEMKEVLPEKVVALGDRNKIFSDNLKTFLSSLDSGDEDEGEQEESMFVDEESPAETETETVAEGDSNE
jgi:hypothetical protein